MSLARNFLFLFLIPYQLVLSVSDQKLPLQSFRTGTGKLHPTHLIWPVTLFFKSSFIGTHPLLIHLCIVYRSFSCYSGRVEQLQQKSYVSQSLRHLLIWLLTKSLLTPASEKWAQAYFWFTFTLKMQSFGVCFHLLPLAFVSCLQHAARHKSQSSCSHSLVNIFKEKACFSALQPLWLLAFTSFLASDSTLFSCHHLDLLIFSHLQLFAVGELYKRLFCHLGNRCYVPVTRDFKAF